jgi:protein NrfC
MAEKKGKSTVLNRRQFITGAGAVVITGAIAGLAACKPSQQEAEEGGLPAIPVSGLIVQNEAVCAGCGTCGLMCSLYHEDKQGLVVARSELDRDPFKPEYVFNVCQQCRSPSCYAACPLKDTALCIDEETGATYVNQDECDGCGQCVEACPFTPKRVELLIKKVGSVSDKEVASVCDLCRGREWGPICVEYCPMNALVYVPKEERSG